MAQSVFASGRHCSDWYSMEPHLMAFCGVFMYRIFLSPYTKKGSHFSRRRFSRLMLWLGLSFLCFTFQPTRSVSSPTRQCQLCGGFTDGFLSWADSIRHSDIRRFLLLLLVGILESNRFKCTFCDLTLRVCSLKDLLCIFEFNFLCHLGCFMARNKRTW